MAPPQVNKLYFKLPPPSSSLLSFPEQHYTTLTTLLISKLKDFDSAATVRSRDGEDLYCVIPRQPDQDLPEEEQPEHDSLSMLIKQMLDEGVIGAYAMLTGERADEGHWRVGVAPF